ncbi:MAG: cell wall hydrolase [Clostridia bacterium]|nr:cell wall hydrolase [Clostridia bacterium]
MRKTLRKDDDLRKATSFVLLMALVLSCFAMMSFASEPKSSVGVFINNQQFNGGVTVKDATTFVGIRKFATSMYPGASVSYNYSTRTLTVKTDKLYLTAKDGDNYIVANGRYLYTKSPVYMRYGVMYAPVVLMAKAFDAKISWSNYSSSFYITRGSGGILSGDKFYRSDEVLWLSRIINAESGAEPFLGKMAVGNVILNRVRSSYFPNTIYGVIFDKKNGTQFSPTANGTIYNTPCEQSVIAAKICLEGYSVNTGILYFVNASVVPNSWVVKNRQLYAKIGNHSFYY